MLSGIKRRLFTVIAVLLIAVFLCGCTPFSSDFELLMSPPALSDEMAPIQEALNEGISGKYTLKYPTGGDNRNAINMIDLNGDGISEAVAIYSTTRDSAVTMHVCVIAKIDGKWKIDGEQSIMGGGVEKVEFRDLDGDAKTEILVGWNIFGTTQKSLCVYSYSPSSMLCLLEESYSEFITCDLDDDFTNDLLIIDLNISLGEATARYFNINERGVNEMGNCQLNPAVTGYFTPILTKLTSGKFCVYLDAYKGAGVTTEVIYFEDGVLKNPLYTHDSAVTSITDRTTVITCRDFDGDSNVEVPIMTAFPVEAQFSLNEQAYLTTWSRFDGESFVPVLYTLLNYTDGYYFTLSREQTEIITVIRNTQNRERIVYEYDYENNEFGSEIFRIRTVAKAAFEAGNYSGDGYSKLDENGDLVYLFKMGNSQVPGYTKEDIENAFTIIREE